MLRAVDAVREGIVRGNAVELGRGLVHVRGPCFAGIVADLGAAVVGDNEPIGIIRRNPQIVVVTVGRVASFEGAPPVGRDVVRDVHDVDAVGVLGVGVDARVVPSTLAQAAVRIEQFPGSTGIV